MVALVFWRYLRGVQFVNLYHLKFERKDAAVGKAFHKQDSAVNFLSPDGHPEKLIEALRSGHVAVPGLAPDLPELVDLFVQLIVPGFRLKHKAFADHVPHEGADHGVHQVAVALQVPRTGADDVPVVAVCVFRALVDRSPVAVDTAMASGVVVALFVHGLTPCLPLERRLRVKPSDDSV